MAECRDFTSGQIHGSLLRQQKGDFFELKGRFLQENISFSEFTDYDTAGIIDRVVQILLSKQSLAEATLECQEACTMLLGWIQEHKEMAESYRKPKATSNNLSGPSDLDSRWDI